MANPLHEDRREFGEQPGNGTGAIWATAGNVAELRWAAMIGHRVAVTDQRTFHSNAERPTVDG